MGNVMKRSTQEISAKYAAEAPTEFFTAHEAMQLDLEAALTRKVGEKHYNQSAHLVWIGDRTRQINGAHVEYFRGIANPIGVKIGPTMKADELKELVQVLNPQKEEGRLMIITRYGAGKVEEMLPAHIEAVKATGVPVVWQCDAVHGNGIVAKSNKYKTRHMDDIVNEILQCIDVQKRPWWYPCRGYWARKRHRSLRRSHRPDRRNVDEELRDQLRPPPKLRARY